MSFTSFSHGGSDRHADNVDNSRSRHSQWGHWGGARRIPSSVAGWQGVGVAALDCPKVRQGAGILDRERYTYGFSGRPLLWLLIDYVCSQCSAAPSACLGVVREQQSPNSGAVCHNYGSCTHLIVLMLCRTLVFPSSSPPWSSRKMTSRRSSR